MYYEGARRKINAGVWDEVKTGGDNFFFTHLSSSFQSFLHEIGNQESMSSF